MEILNHFFFVRNLMFTWLNTWNEIKFHSFLNWDLYFYLNDVKVGNVTTQSAGFGTCCHWKGGVSAQLGAVVNLFCC